MKSIHKTLTLTFVLIALAMAAACTRTSTVQIGSHKVTVARHGFEKKFEVDDRATVPSFEYRGVSTDGRGLKVLIKGDKVKINDADAGQLRPGDSLLIGDEGVAVNQMDYGESAKYLKENSPKAETSSLN
jgi:hypothetical protein